MKIFLWCIFLVGLSLFEVGTMLRDHSQDAGLKKLDAAITCVQHPQKRHYLTSTDSIIGFGYSVSGMLQLFFLRTHDTIWVDTHFIKLIYIK